MWEEVSCDSRSFTTSTFGSSMRAGGSGGGPAGNLVVKVILGARKLTHSLTETTGEFGQLLCPEEQKDNEKKN
jgi:hypothetical protein